MGEEELEEVVELVDLPFPFHQILDKEATERFNGRRNREGEEGIIDWGRGELLVKLRLVNTRNPQHPGTLQLTPPPRGAIIRIEWSEE